MTGSVRCALISIPDEPGVAYSGSGLLDLLTILTSTGMGKGMRVLGIRYWVLDIGHMVQNNASWQ